MIQSARRLATRGLAVVALSLFGAACADTSEAGPAQQPADGTSADLLSSVQSPGAGMQSSVPVAGGVSTQEQELDLDALGYNDGPDDALVRVIEFSDFGCGYCRQFHLESYPVLLENYMDEGKVQWKYVPMISGMFQNSMAATMVAECSAEQGRWVEMRDLMFENQQEWKSSSDPAPIVRGYAQEMGLNMDELDTCLQSGDASQRIDIGTQLSREVGVRGTPTFFVVGYAPIPGAIPLELFREVLDTVYVEALAQQQGAGGDR